MTTPPAHYVISRTELNVVFTYSQLSFALWLLPMSFYREVSTKTKYRVQRQLVRWGMPGWGSAPVCGQPGDESGEWWDPLCAPVCCLTVRESRGLMWNINNPFPMSASHFLISGSWDWFRMWSCWSRRQFLIVILIITSADCQKLAPTVQGRNPETM